MAATAVKEMGGAGNPMSDGMVKFFQRKGQVGKGLKEVLKSEQAATEWRVWIEEEMKGTDLSITLPPT